MATPADLAGPNVDSASLRRLRRASSIDLTWSSWWRDVRSRKDTAARGRFSVDKARRFIAYANTTSRFRRFAVLSLYPVPGLIIALALALLPLRDPHLGMAANWMFCVQVFWLNFIAAIGMMVLARALSGVSHSEYSTQSIALIAIITASLMAGTVFVVGITWCFPIPFSWALASMPFITFVGLAHVIVFRGVRSLSRLTRTRLLLVVPSIALQISQMLIYPAYSTLFLASKEWQQIVLVVVFPGIKYALKRSIFLLSRHVGDLAREASSCGVEIYASIYQATIMQGTPSPLVTAAIIGLDVLLNVVHVKRYLERCSIVPTEQLIEKAMAILVDPARPNFDDHALAPFATTRPHSPASVAPTPSDAIQEAERYAAVAPSTKELSDSDRDRVVLVHALEILQSAEVILLDEYLEVIVPFVNACFVVGASQLPSAVYNPTLVDFHFDPSQLRPAVLSILLYTLLQGVTFAGMYAVMRIRYRLSAFELLAFVMETHRWSLLVKLTMWFVAIVATPVIHYGMDFTFRFEFVVRSS